MALQLVDQSWFGHAEFFGLDAHEKPFGDIGNATFENDTDELWVSGHAMYGIQRPDRPAEEDDAAGRDTQAADDPRHILKHADQRRLARRHAVSMIFGQEDIVASNRPKYNKLEPYNPNFDRHLGRPEFGAFCSLLGLVEAGSRT